MCFAFFVGQKRLPAAFCNCSVLSDLGSPADQATHLTGKRQFRDQKDLPLFQKKTSRRDFVPRRLAVQTTLSDSFAPTVRARI